MSTQTAGVTFVKRHSAVVRATHWINALCLFFLLLSGLQIFNAHPRLYWGHYGAESDPAIFAIAAVPDGDALRGEVQIAGLAIQTTGVLGVSQYNGAPRARAFPAWATIPSERSLAKGRRWHFFFAWGFVLSGLVYLIHGVRSGHFWRDLAPDRDQLTPRHLLREIADHLRLRFARGDETRRYNTLQKFAYIAMVAVVLPGIVLTGLTMSPGFNAAVPWLVDVFGGRQSARTLHFVFATATVLFVIVHLVMVAASGVYNNLRSMITGQFAIEKQPS